jgi:cytochrome c556
VGALAVLALVAACGSGAGIAKDDYLKRGDAICTRTAAAQAKLKAPSEGDLPGTAGYLRASAALIDTEIAQLRKLGTPSGDATRLHDLLQRESDAVAVLRRAASAADAEQQKQASDLLDQAKAALGDIGTGLRDYGFGVCGT